MKVLEFRFGHYTPAIQDVPELLLLNGDEVGVVLGDTKKVVCTPGCRLFRMKDKKLPHFTAFPLFNRCGYAPTAFHCVDGVQDREGAICENSPPASLHHPVQVWLGKEGGVPGVGRMDLRVARQIQRGAPSGGEAGSTVLG
jgi:hypothetical protein